MRKYFEVNENKKQHSWAATKAILRGKLRAWNIYIRKKRSQISYLFYTLRNKSSRICPRNTESISHFKINRYNPSHKKLKNKNYKIISVQMKHLTKSNIHFWSKLRQTRNKGNFLSLLKGICQNPTASIRLNWEGWNTFP